MDNSKMMKLRLFVDHQEDLTDWLRSNLGEYTPTYTNNAEVWFHHTGNVGGSLITELAVIIMYPVDDDCGDVYFSNQAWEEIGKAFADVAE